MICFCCSMSGDSWVTASGSGQSCLTGGGRMPNGNGVCNTLCSHILELCRYSMACFPRPATCNSSGNITGKVQFQLGLNVFHCSSLEGHVVCVLYLVFVHAWCSVFQHKSGCQLLKFRRVVFQARRWCIFGCFSFFLQHICWLLWPQ